MNAGIRRLALCLFTTALVTSVIPSGRAASQEGNTEMTKSVRRMLERLPYYGVFDFMAFSVDKGVVTLCGYSFDRLKQDAGMAAMRTTGVLEVDNKIEQ